MSSGGGARTGSLSSRVGQREIDAHSVIGEMRRPGPPDRGRRRGEAQQVDGLGVPADLARCRAPMRLGRSSLSESPDASWSGCSKAGQPSRTRCARPAPRRGNAAAARRETSSREPIERVTIFIPVSIDRRPARNRPGADHSPRAHLAFWAEVDERDLVQQVIIEPSPPCAAAPLWSRWSGPPPPSRAISPGRRREPTRARSKRECRKRPPREPGHRGRRPALASSD